MPYSAKQNRLFRAAAHDSKIAKGHGLSQATASRLAAEGIKGQRHKVSRRLGVKGY